MLNNYLIIREVSRECHFIVQGLSSSKIVLCTFIMILFCNFYKCDDILIIPQFVDLNKSKLFLQSEYVFKNTSCIIEIKLTPAANTGAVAASTGAAAASTGTTASSTGAAASVGSMENIQRAVFELRCECVLRAIGQHIS